MNHNRTGCISSWSYKLNNFKEKNKDATFVLSITANESWGYGIKLGPTRKLASKSTSFERNGMFTPSHALPRSRLWTCSIFSVTQLDIAHASLPIPTAPPLNRTKHYFHESIRGDGKTTHRTPQQVDSAHSTGRQAFTY